MSREERKRELPPPSGVRRGWEIRRYDPSAQGTCGDAPVSVPAESPKRRGELRVILTAVACVMMAACLIVGVGVAARSATADRMPVRGGRDGVSRFLLALGLPTTDRSPLSGWWLTGGDYEGETSAAPTDTHEATGDEPDTVEPNTAPVTDGAGAPSDTVAPDTSSEEGERESGAESEPETTPALPAGSVPIVALDVSESDRGVGYVRREDGGRVEGCLPAWDAPPRVLIVSTHPYEGYGDGGAYYLPDGEGWAISEHEGAVALGAQLATALRDRGVMVIHATQDGGESYLDSYEAAEAQIAYWQALYTDVDLVIDVGRSAELTPDGGILRTAGVWAGEPCAQIGVSVDADRPAMQASCSLGLAQAIRAYLWEVSDTLSRPVTLSSGEGLSASVDSAVINVELGAAGNTYAEAQALIEPLADAIGAVITGDT